MANNTRRTKRRCDPLARAIAFGFPMAALIVGAASMVAVGDETRPASAPRSGIERHAGNAVGLGSAATPESQSCVACHAMIETASHPVNARPSMRVPATLPLVNGTVGCATCHDTDAARGHTTKHATGQAFLRGEGTGEALCVRCHDASSAQPKPHATSRMKVHASVKPTTPPRGISGKGVTLDAESKNCMACHDGSTAGDAGSHAGLSGTIGGNGDHPIGVAYKNRASTDGDPILLTPKASLDKRVRLFNDALGCGSCHSVYAKQRKLLVMDNTASRLCLACHIE